MVVRYFQDRPAIDAYLPKGSMLAAEIGVDSGLHAECVLKIAYPQKLFLVDPWCHEGGMVGPNEMEVTKARLASYIDSGVVEIVRSFGCDWLDTLADQSMDWIYLDTMHTYDETVQELQAMRRVVKLGGVIAGHDFVLGKVNPLWKAGVARAVIEAIQDGWLVLEGISDEVHATWVGRRIR